MKKSKQVIVIRKDLNMRKGKIAAQAAHASMKVFLDRMEQTGDSDILIRKLTMQRGSAEDLWLNGIFAKICVYVNGEEELLSIYRGAKERNLLCALIEDNGLTEFKGVKTLTCCAIGPAFSEEVDLITGHLPLL